MRGILTAQGSDVANIPDQLPEWVRVRLIEKTDKVLGGPGGVANQQAVQLLQCITHVRKGVDDLGIALQETDARTVQAQAAADAAVLSAQAATTSANAAHDAADGADAKATAALASAANAQTYAETADTKATAAQSAAGLAGNEAAQAMVAANGKAVRVDLGTVTVTYSAVLALGAGARSVTVACPGAHVGDAVFVAATGAIPDGYAVGAAQCLVVDVIRVSIVHPALVLGASFSIPLRVFALR